MPRTAISPWSFSKMKAFKQCPKQFYHLKVALDYTEPETEAMLYGTAFHEAAEKFIRDGEPVPKKFEYAAKALQRLRDKPGKKLCEYKLGITRDLDACDFYSNDAWFRGIADLIILDGNTAWVLDYKTGRSAKYADKSQLELMALAVFKHFPEITTVRGGLLFVVARTLVKDRYESAMADILWKKWLVDYAMLEVALQTGTWNPRPSGLCRQHCPVVECAHNGRN
jgi:hypothetical protein